MALLPTGWIKMPGDNDETKRFAWSHVKSIFYNKAANILLKDKLDEMDKIIDEKIAKALMSNVQVNDQSKIPTSALAYAMQQSITKNGQDIAKLNSDLAPSVYPIPKPSSINGLDNITIWEVRAFKSGKIVCLTLNIDGVLSANTDWKMLFTLPKEYRPSEGSVILNYITQHGKAMVIDINTGGDVRIVCPSGEDILKGDWVCRQCITYITKI